jgi:hypothetical protein
MRVELVDTVAGMLRYGTGQLAQARSGQVGQELKHRVMIVSRPKAGTYLLSEVVRMLGLRQTLFHFSME